jgi:ribonucleoside-triphosphate reductase
MGTIDTNKLVDDYMLQRDWRVKENSNAPFSFGQLNKYINGAVSKQYWTDRVYDEVASATHNDGFLHIHDMSGLTIYCCGYSLQKVLDYGVKGVPNIPTSKPAKHFDAALNQLANMVTIFQNEIMGAVAFSSFDTLLAPFIKVDNLSYREVKQSIQNYIYSVNSNSRAGAEPAFSNLTFDLFPPRDLKDMPAKIANEYMDFTYGDCQKEMDMLNKAFFEVMLEGDAAGKPFAYPIPTYSIMKGFDWDNPNNDLLWEMAGKYGYPYFSNFINSDMDPSDVRSMCCRLRLDLSELQRRNGGLFGSGDSTGSIGVVTLNLPRIGYLTKGESKEALFAMIKDYMDIARDSLEEKRNWLEMHIVGTGMVPAFDTYVGTLDNHFSTIGFVGLNEMCVNFFGDGMLDSNTESIDNSIGILSEEGKALAEEVLDYMRGVLLDYQKLTGHLYNLEATPAESTCYRLAKLDKKAYPEIYTQGAGTNVYYTNSCHMPVKEVKSIQQLLDHQNSLQVKMTGGTVVHLYMAHGISGDQAKNIIKHVCENYSLPYVSISPVICYCPTCGVIETPVGTCPHCGGTTKYMQRITGYIRDVCNYNPGKLQEFKDRNQLGVE